MTTTIDEQVICIPADRARDLIRPGLNRVPLDYLLWHAGYRFRSRSEVEADETVLHLATYGVLTCDNRVFTYRRGKSGGESRLHHRRSLGVGGHVTIEDCATTPFGEIAVRVAVDCAARREVNEEVAWDGPVASVRLGLLYDDADAVSRVHLGVAYRYELADTSATAREDCLADARWEPIAAVREDTKSYEGWSKILLEAI